MNFIGMLFISLFTCMAMGFPQILSWKKSPIIAYENKKTAILKKNEKLKSAFAIVTANEDQVLLSFNYKDEVNVHPKTKVQVLELNEDSGFISDLYLLDGKLDFKSNFKGQQKDFNNFTIHTDFFDLKISQNTYFQIFLNIKESIVEVRVFEGILPLEFFSHEKKLVLKTGEKVAFKGVLAENGGIKYDYLLNKKIPQGEMSEVEKFNVGEYFKETSKFDLVKKKEELIPSKAKIRKKEALNNAVVNSLCRKPSGNLGQCYWQKAVVGCYRYKCNASGKWSDKTERPKHHCVNNVVIKDCDY